MTPKIECHECNNEYNMMASIDGKLYRPFCNACFSKLKNQQQYKYKLYKTIKVFPPEPRTPS